MTNLSIKSESPAVIRYFCVSTASIRPFRRSQSRCRCACAKSRAIIVADCRNLLNYWLLFYFASSTMFSIRLWRMDRIALCILRIWNRERSSEQQMDGGNVGMTDGGSGRKIWQWRLHEGCLFFLSKLHNYGRTVVGHSPTTSQAHAAVRKSINSSSNILSGLTSM